MFLYNPDIPDVPDIPNVPDTPDIPDTPDVPNIPWKPDVSWFSAPGEHWDTEYWASDGV